jgi:predicted amidophosphoribosyltransferase
MVLEPLIAFLLVYILYIPERSLDWTMEDLPESPATKFISDKTKDLKKKVPKLRTVCPECGTKLKIEKKVCPSCISTQNFGWCVKSEAYVLPCANCGSMALFGKETCDRCSKELSDSVACNNCNEAIPVREWMAQT